MLFKKIDKNSLESISSALNVFSPPPTNVSVQKSEFKEFLPLNAIDQPPFNFKITPGSSYLDMSKCSIVTEFLLQKKKEDGTWVNVEEKDNVGVINNLGSAFIKNIRVSIGGQQVYNANNLYSYKAHLDTELSYNTEAKKNFLTSSGYYYNSKDDPNSATGEGFKRRAKRLSEGRVAQYEAKLHVDVFDQDAYFLNNCEIDFEVSPQDQEFLLHAPTFTGVLRLSIVACRLKVKTLDLQASLALDMEKMLDKKPASYGYRRVEMKSYFLTPSATEINQPLFSEQIPRRLVVGLVAKEDYNGKISKDPFNFQHFNLENIQVNYNGIRNPSNPYKLDFKNDRYARAYYDLHEALGYANTNDGIGISYEKYKIGSCFYAFNLTTNQENDNSFDLLKEGATFLHLAFKEANPGVMLIVLAEFDAMMFMDKHRNVRSDLSV